MTKPHGADPAGRPVDLIGQPLAPGIGSAPSLVVIRRKDSTMPKAEKDGVYRIGRGQFKVRKGDVIPEGAEIEVRKEEAAPENRKKDAAPENRAKSAKKSDD